MDERHDEDVFATMGREGWGRLTWTGMTRLYETPPCYSPLASLLASGEGQMNYTLMSFSRRAAGPRRQPGHSGSYTRLAFSSSRLT